LALQWNSYILATEEVGFPHSFKSNVTAAVRRYVPRRPDAEVGERRRECPTARRRRRRRCVGRNYGADSFDTTAVTEPDRRVDVTNRALGIQLVFVADEQLATVLDAGEKRSEPDNDRLGACLV